MNVAHDGYRVRAELLAETNRDSILHLGTAHFDDVIKFVSFHGECFMEAEQFFFQIRKKPQGRHFTGSRDYVVCGLSPVYVIVRGYD